MTILTKPIRRETVGELDGSFCRDRGRKLIVTLSLGDVVIFKPKGMRAQQDTLSLFDAYRYAIRCRVGRENLEKARAKKERKAIRLAALRQNRAEKRLTKG